MTVELLAARYADRVERGWTEDNDLDGTGGRSYWFKLRHGWEDPTNPGVTSIVGPTITDAHTTLRGLRRIAAPETDGIPRSLESEVAGGDDADVSGAIIQAMHGRHMGER